MSEPFNLRSPTTKKTEFKVLSSNLSLVWLRAADSNFQLEGSADKKIIVNFNAEAIVERHARIGLCEGVVIGLKWDRGIQYFGFRFNVY